MKNAKVLVIGSGGREHALGKKLSESPSVAQVIVAPGNAGMPQSWDRWTGASAGRKGLEELAVRARESGIDLVVVGPDQVLADGAVDVMSQNGILAFGPTAAAAKIESSKAFAKDVMDAAGVPTAAYHLVEQLAQAEALLKSLAWPPNSHGWVIKADGLALGKGVQVCKTLPEALDAVRSLIGISGALVVEECLVGEEVSWMAFCDGDQCALLDSARDYKRLLNENEGPNTGGMGAMSPVPGLPANFEERVRREVFEPVLREMKNRGTPFRGLLYAGLMVDVAREKIWVLEFNARFGDPETQVLLPRMKDDLFKWCLASASGELGLADARATPRVQFDAETAVFVVATAAGYPENPRKGQKITKVSSDNLYFAGVTGDPERVSELVTAGGRVLGALGQGATFEAARNLAYERISQVQFDGVHYRTDIAAGNYPGLKARVCEGKNGGPQGAHPALKGEVSLCSIVLLASGRGSNFDAIHAAIQSGHLAAEILAVISDQPNAGVLEKARKAGLPTYAVPTRNTPNGTALTRTQHEARLLEIITPLRPRFLVLAGYMRLLTPEFINRFRVSISTTTYTRIINVHPSLLPSFPGVASYRQAFHYGTQLTGVTVHLVEPEMDSGPICAQAAFSISDCRDEKEVEARGLALEHELYPRTLSWVLSEKFQLETRPEGRLFVRQN